MKIRDLLLALGVTAALASPVKAQDKPVKVVADVVASEAEGRSFARPNIFYNLLGVDGYTFIEMYSDDKTYFGKTILGKKLGAGFSATGEYVFGNDTKNRAGVGVKYSPPLPKGASLTLKLLPVWITKDGYDRHRVQAGYSGSVTLPAGFELSSFGEFNATAEHGAQWGYGELFVGRQLGKHLSLHGGALLRDMTESKENKLRPGLELAGRLSYSF